MTLKQIAAEAGVSAMTVSNVINNNTDKVSEETRERVQAIIDKYHYTPNMSARSLSSRSSRIIAILMPIYKLSEEQAKIYGTSSEGYNALSDQYVSLLIGILENQLKKAGYYVMLRSFSSTEEVLSLQRNWQIDGCIMVMPHSDKVTREILKTTTCPLVVIDRNYPDLNMLSVIVNDYRGGYLATQECIRSGHRKIAFVSTGSTDAVNHSSVIHSRYQGYQAALRDCAISEDPSMLFAAPSTLQGGRHCADDLLKLPKGKRPTAIFATSDSLAIGIIARLQEAGIRVPEDISVIGYDNIPISTLFTPKLTTIAQDMDHKAEAAIGLLQQAIEDPSFRQKTVEIDVSVVQRDSLRSIE